MNDKILLYLSDKLTEKEKVDFESEIEKSSVLKNQVDRCRTKLKEIKELNDIEVDDSYFINMLPKIHEKMDKRKEKSLFPKLAYVVPLLVIIAVLIFYQDNSLDDFSKTVANLPDSSKEEIVNLIDKESEDLSSESMKEENTKETVEKEISNSIDLENINIDTKLDYSDDYEMISNLSSEEVENIYNAMADKKLF